MNKFLVLLVTIGVAAAIEKVPVTIYYEPLCPDSQKFFTKQFTPTWRDLHDYINLKLVPFGKANGTSYSNPNWNSATATSAQGVTWICSHGPNECEGDKFQACAIDPEARISTDNQVMFIDCLMTNGKKEEPYQTTATMCANKSPEVNINSLINCVAGEKGSNLVWQNQKTTLALYPKLGFVPTVVFKHMYNQADNDMAQTSFRSTLCKHINESPKPKLCESSNGVRATTTGLTMLVSAGLIFRLL